MLDAIEIRGARTHNLKNIDCRFRHQELSVVTGVSGSGKSSLAFDTLYAEGQRRFVESMSTYARQFLDRMERPDLDSISGVQPAIALEQKNGVKSARSTVGTATEIHDFLRLLFAKLGRTHCPDCKIPVQSETPESAMRTLDELEKGERLTVLGPTEILGGHLSHDLRAEFIRSGYYRLWDGTGIIDLEAGEAPANDKAELSVLIDRIVWEEKNRTRVHEALQKAFTAGRGRAVVMTGGDRRLHFSAGMSCDRCHRSFPSPEPQMFSFYSPLGACPECEGFGRVMELDLEKVIPNPALSIDEGAIAPWNSDGNLELYDLLKQRTTPREIPRLKPIAEFSAEQRRNLIEGAGKFKGVRGYFNWLESKKYKVQARVMLARYRAYRTCSVCLGSRLKPEALNVIFRERTLPEIGMLSVELALTFFRGLKLTAQEQEVAGKVFEALIQRLEYLDNIGLPYLTLDRATRTLSGGESQRINLATSLGSGLTQTLYVLDEPTVGLHSRDTERLIGVLRSLRDLGNTVVVVEHDLDVIRAADHVLDLGPGAGEAGGQILFEGPQAELERCDSPTAHHIRDYRTPPVPSRERRPSGHLKIRGAKGNNLKNVTVKIPLGGICCVVGVSGSGKTTLIRDTLVAFYRRQRDIAPVEAEPCRGIDGLHQVRELHFVDQQPPARSRRSNPVTYVKAFDAIRKVLAGTREAKAAGLEPKHFSFNVDAGRCPTCQGTGYQTIDMHFMADVEVMCEECDGHRFKPSVLAYRWRGKNIDEILRLTVDEAATFFKGEDKAVRALRPLREVGLGYLRLGQSTATLSGGEAQRLKLAGHLTRIREGDGLVFIFDEPTTGLHPADLKRLLTIFHEMADRGCTLIVIEHNLDLIAAADTIIELGPEGGERGGEIVASGTLKDLLRSDHSPTGHYLRERFGEALLAGRRGDRLEEAPGIRPGSDRTA
jgi:excinuclease ABC subunit A